MPRKHLKLLEKARRSNTGWNSRDLIRMVTGFGFEHVSTTGSHQTFRHPEFKELRITIAVHPGDLARFYIDTAVELIDEVLEKEREKDDGESS